MPESPASSLFAQFASGWRGYVLIALIAFAAAQFGAGRMPVTDLDESRYAQAARQMIETGDYARIRLQDADRGETHWRVLAASGFGRDVRGPRRNNMWAYRLPSALGWRWRPSPRCGADGADRATARAAGRGAVRGGDAGGPSRHAGHDRRAARRLHDFGHGALARLRMSTARPKLHALVFWAALACAVLIKGPVAPLVVGLTLGCWRFGSGARWMALLRWWPGPLLALSAIAAPWFVSINLATDGAFQAGMAGDVLPKMTRGDALPGTYTFLLPFLIFPATYALPAAARMAFRRRRAPREDENLGGAALSDRLGRRGLCVFRADARQAAALRFADVSGDRAAVRSRAFSDGRARLAHHASGGSYCLALPGAVIVALTAASATLMPGDAAADIRRAVSAGLVGFGVLGLRACGAGDAGRRRARARSCCARWCFRSAGASGCCPKRGSCM